MSSINGTSTLTNFCSFDFKIFSSFRNMGMDLLKKLKQHSHEFIIPSNSNTFLIPLHSHVFLILGYISQIYDHVCLLLLESQKVHSHIVHFLLGSSESLKQTWVMNEVICNADSVIWM